MRKFARFAFFALLACGALHAGPVLSILPPGAGLSGLPGHDVTWNFRVANDADFMLVLQVDYQTVSPAGTFSDLFSGTAPVLGAGQYANGAGAYSIDLPATPGFLSSGRLVLTYNTYTRDLADPDFNPDTDLVIENGAVEAPVSVLVLATPEPATASLFAIAAGAFLLARRRRSTQ